MLERCYALLGQPFCDGVAGAFVVILLVALLLFVLALALFALAYRQIRDLDIPQDADFFETMRVIPITIPLALDILDLIFDIFAAPISWLILEAMGLKALQAVTVVEGLIPGTQPIPTMTAGWILARVTNPSAPSVVEHRMREAEYQLPEGESQRPARRSDRFRRGDYGNME